jgi:hypothetical protein
MTRGLPFRRIGIVAAFAVPVLLMQASLAAADFVFVVPVELHHIHKDARSWFISVLVIDANWAEGANITQMIVAEGGASIEAVNGEYVGTLTIPCVTRSGRNPADGAVYRVMAGFRTPENPSGTWAVVASGKYARDGSKPCVVNIVRQMPNYTGYTRAPK